MASNNKKPVKPIRKGSLALSSSESTSSVTADEKDKSKPSESESVGSSKSAAEGAGHSKAPPTHQTKEEHSPVKISSKDGEGGPKSHSTERIVSFEPSRNPVVGKKSEERPSKSLSAKTILSVQATESSADSKPHLPEDEAPPHAPEDPTTRPPQYVKEIESVTPTEGDPEEFKGVTDEDTPPTRNESRPSLSSSPDGDEEARLQAESQGVEDSTFPEEASDLPSRSVSASSNAPPSKDKTRPPGPEELILYHNEQSYFSQIARMALYFRAIKFTPIEIDITKGEQYTEEFLRLNPRGEVPVLHDGRTNWILNECFDILRYLNNEFPEANGPPLIPKRHFSAERVERLCMRLLKLKLDWLTFGSIVFEDVPCEPHGIFADPEVRDKIRQFLKHRKPILESQLQKHSDDVDQQLQQKIRNLDKDWHYIENKEDYHKLIEQFQAVFEEIVANLEAIKEEVVTIHRQGRKGVSVPVSSETEAWLSPEGPSAADCVLAVMLHRIYLLGFGRKLIGPVEPLKAYFQQARGLEAFQRAVGDEYTHSASRENCKDDLGNNQEAEGATPTEGAAEAAVVTDTTDARFEIHHLMIKQMVRVGAGYEHRGPSKFSTVQDPREESTILDRIEAPPIVKKDCRAVITETMRRTTRKSNEDAVVRLWREGAGNRQVLPQRSSTSQDGPRMSTGSDGEQEQGRLSTGGERRRSSLRQGARQQQQQQRPSAGAVRPKHGDFPFWAAMVPAGTVMMFALIGLLQGPAPRRVLIGPQTLLAAEIARFWQQALQ